MVPNPLEKAVVSTKFIDDSDESDGNDTYQDEGSSDEREGEINDDNEEEEEAVMSEPEPVEVPSTPRKRGRPHKIPATPTPAKGKKRSINEVAASDSDGSFVASPIRDSPKKPRVVPSTTKKPPATPSKSTPAKNKITTKMKTTSPTKVKTTPAVSNKATSPSKAPPSSKKSKVTSSNDDNDGQEQESVVSDDDPSKSGHDSPTPTGKKNKAHQVMFNTSMLKAKASIEESKKKKATQDVFDKDVTTSDSEIADDLFVLC
ncbi:hypothetical protein K443DRAFT_135697 [Laccaria amethystina LaAM-08-1]|uniref:Uncharacterized protein n=1 Tax=Laccaria amethystina LaAM-08-1 TaxID=1095629 RepID=A0A0C9WLF0_9AGAR|nr:hypothetical protein K443DRAFT_135697 [Laccaria amethystina LaAM-08-1]